MPYPLENDLAKVLAHVNVAPPAPSAHDSALAAFDPVIARAMAKEVSDRFASATELANAAAEAV